MLVAASDPSQMISQSLNHPTTSTGKSPQRKERKKPCLGLQTFGLISLKQETEVLGRNQVPWSWAASQSLPPGVCAPAVHGEPSPHPKVMAQGSHQGPQISQRRRCCLYHLSWGLQQLLKGSPHSPPQHSVSILLPPTPPQSSGQDLSTGEFNHFTQWSPQ